MKDTGTGTSIKEVLAEIQALDRRIRLLEEEIEFLKSECLPGGIRYDIDRVQTSPQADRLGTIFSKVTEKEEMLTFEIMSAVTRKMDLIESINRMNDTEEALALYYRYCEHVRYEDLGECLGWSPRQTARILKRAEEHFRVMPPQKNTAGNAVFLGEGDKDEYWEEMQETAKIMA